VVLSLAEGNATTRDFIKGIVGSATARPLAARAQSESFGPRDATVSLEAKFEKRTQHAAHGFCGQTVQEMKIAEFCE
jgi:hypothetical protein